MRFLGFKRLVTMLVLLTGSQAAWAQAVPRRQIPASVLAELAVVESRFELALAMDCAADLCYSKGCTYSDHAVIDRGRSSSLPGLGDGSGPGSVEPQEFLTRATCAFAHEDSVSAEDAEVLSRRLGSRVSKGFAVVSVTRQELQPLAAHVKDPSLLVGDEPEEDKVVEPQPAGPVEWSASVAARELWTSLLPHFAWMIAVIMLTIAATVLFWAWRRVGRETLEEKMMLHEMLNGDGGSAEPAAEAEPEALSADDKVFMEEQAQFWSERLSAMSPEKPDVELQALVHELLKAGDMPLLAKAVLTFPESFLGTFPEGGDIVTAKLELAEYLKHADIDALPADHEFYRALNVHARAAALHAQSDALLVRSLREDFGASGLVALIGTLPARSGALLFALAPSDEQFEMVRLLSSRQMGILAEQLLRSNRMDPAETGYLFEVLRAARAGDPAPATPRTGDVTDRGVAFDAAGALSVLLPGIPPDARSALFGAAIQRFHGSLPAWYRGILVADMLFELSNEARADVMLELDVESLSAWLSLQDADVRQRILDGLPLAVRGSIEATSSFASRSRQLALAERGRRELAKGFQRRLAQAGGSFERVVHPEAATGP
jgi:hypothetical protein